MQFLSLITHHQVAEKDFPSFSDHKLRSFCWNLRLSVLLLTATQLPL